jgi:hypothetical protein
MNRWLCTRLVGIASLALVGTFAVAEGEDTPRPATPAEHLQLLRQAHGLYEAGEFGQAAPLYERLLAADPFHGTVKIRLARSLLETGQFDRGHALAIEALEAGFGPEATGLLLLARAAAAAGKGDLALDLLERAVATPLERRPDLKTDEAFASLRSNPRFRRIAGFLPEGELTREEGWRYDLDFFLAEARRLHAAPSRVAHSPEFAASVEALKRRVGDLTDDEISVELQKIVVSLGDGHTHIRPGSSERVKFQMLPVVFYFFTDGVYIVDAEESRHDLIGSRVAAIGGRPLDGVIDDLRPFVNRDNDQGLLWMGPLLLRHLGMLRAMGHTDRTDRAALTLEDREGRRRDVELTPGTHEGSSSLPPPRGVTPPLWLSRPDRMFWLEPLPPAHALYVQINGIQNTRDKSLAAFTDDIRAALAEHRSRHLILDLRRNPGGNNFLIWPLVRLVITHEEAHPDNRVFVITGRNTFSACQNFINFLDRMTVVTFVGEPSSSRPNFVGESTRVELPWSGLMLSISSRYWQDSFPGDRRPYIQVSLPVQLSSADYFAGRDPVMEALAELMRTP